MKNKFGTTKLYKVHGGLGRPESIHKQLEMVGCMLSTVATDVLVQKHQAINIHSSLIKKYYIRRE